MLVVLRRAALASRQQTLFRGIATVEIGRSKPAPGEEAKPGPLEGVRVIEVGNFIAGPYCGTMLGYFGAEVIKIEPPGGDQIRQFRDVDKTGTSWWWRGLSRNKKSICLDLKKPGAQKIVADLCSEADVLIENFKPGKMEEWNLGPEQLQAFNEALVYTRISGYGQSGPYSSRPGFASACEAMGGFRYVNGFKDRPSVRPNLSIGDTLAGIHAAMGTVMALYAREGNPGMAGSACAQKGKGQIVDSAIYESVWSVMEGVLSDYSGTGAIREASGSTITGIVPTNTYNTKDGKSVVIGANSDSLFKRLMNKAGLHEMAEDPKFATNVDRVANQKELDDAIEAWTNTLTSEEVLAKAHEAQVPNGLIYSVEDCVNDPQYQARGMIESLPVPELGRDVLVPAIAPKMSMTPGASKWAGGWLGEHTKEIFADVLTKYDQDTIQGLVENGSVIWPERLAKPWGEGQGI